MATIWENIKRYAKQIGITYNEVDKTYNQNATNYSGKLGTIWTERDKN